MTVRNATFREVIGGHFDLHFVTGQDLDVVHTHFAGDMSDNLVSVFQFDAEHGVAEGFDNGSV